MVRVGSAVQVRSAAPEGREVKDCKNKLIFFNKINLFNE